MKFDFFGFINSNQFLNHDFKLTNNNSFNFDSIKTNNYKIIESYIIMTKIQSEKFLI